MLLFVTVIHLFVAVLLIGFVLLQDSKGGGVFGMGGGSNQIMSSTGAANFMVKTTRWLAIVFAATCISLTILTSKSSNKSVVDDYAPAAGTTTPAETLPTPAATDAPAQAPAQTNPENK